MRKIRLIYLQSGRNDNELITGLSLTDLPLTLKVIMRTLKTMSHIEESRLRLATGGLVAKLFSVTTWITDK